MEGHFLLKRTVSNKFEVYACIIDHSVKQVPLGTKGTIRVWRDGPWQKDNECECIRDLNGEVKMKCKLWKRWISGRPATASDTYTTTEYLASKLE